MLWTDGSVPFPLGKGGSGVLANCSLCGTEATLSFSAGPVCSLVSAAPKSLPLFFSSYQTLVLSSPPCPLLRLSFYLNLSGRSGRNCLLFLVLSDYNESQDTRFSGETTRLMSWPDWEHHSCPLQSRVVSLFLPLVSSLLFSRTGGVLSHGIVIHTGFLDFHRGTCASSSCSLCSLSSTKQRTQPSVNLLSL